MGDVWPYLATAAGTLGVNALVQFWFVPKVETRKRRDARWESDLLALGEFMEFDFSDALAAWMSAVYGASFLHDPPPDADPEWLARSRTEIRAELRDTGDRLGRAASKVRWLLRRALAEEGFSGEAAKLRFRMVLAKHELEDAIYAANDADRDPLDGDQSLQLKRDLDARFKPINDYAQRVFDRAAPRRQTRVGYRLRRRGRNVRKWVVRLIEWRPSGRGDSSTR